MEASMFHSIRGPMGFVLDECRTPSLQPAEDAIVDATAVVRAVMTITSYRGSSDQGVEVGVA